MNLTEKPFIKIHKIVLSFSAKTIIHCFFGINFASLRGGGFPNRKFNTKNEKTIPCVLNLETQKCEKQFLPLLHEHAVSNTTLCKFAIF